MMTRLLLLGVTFSLLAFIATGCCCCGELGDARFNRDGAKRKRGPRPHVAACESPTYRQSQDMPVVYLAGEVPQNAFTRLASITIPMHNGQAATLAALRQKASRAGANAIMEVEAVAGELRCVAVRCRQD